MTRTPPIATRALRLRSEGPEMTKRLAATLAATLVDGDLLVLTGDLGAGKTCFTQGLGRGLGIDDRITSPTFTLANRYQGRLVLNHLDVYRLDGEADAADLDLDDLLDDGVTVVEWGDRIEGLLPPGHFVVALRFGDLEPGDGDPGALDDVRLIDIEGPVGERGLEQRLAEWLVP